MKKLKTPVFCALFFLSCNNKPEELALEAEVDNVIKNASIDTSRNISLQFNPPDNSVYIFKTQNETSYILEYDKKQVNSSSVSNVQYRYTVHKDSASGFNIDVLFDSIKVTTQKDDVVMEADAENAALSVNPLDRMLAILKNQPLQVQVSASGLVKSIAGYEELGQSFLAKFAESDIYGKTIAKEQWEKIIMNGLVKGQFSQLFKVLPNSQMYQGFTWKSKERLEGELVLDMESVFKVKSIDPAGLVVIVSKADVKSPENETFDIAGQKGITAKLSGQRNGILYIDVNTGIVKRSEYTSDISGEILAFGTFVPIKIKNRIGVKQERKFK